MKFGFMLLTVFAIGTLFVNDREHIPCRRLDDLGQELGQEDEPPIIKTETSKRNRILGE